VIFKEKDEDGRDRVIDDEERVSIQGNSTYKISEIVRLSSRKNFIRKKKNLILDTLIDFEPV